VIETAGIDLTDPANELALRSLGEDLVAQGKADAALRRVDAALAAQADRASLHELRGSVLARTGRTADAQTAYEKALALDAGSARALAGLGVLRSEAGDLAGAIDLLDRAAKAAPSDPTPAYQAAQLLLAAGRTDESEARLRAIASQGPAPAGARNDLAWILAEKGQDLDLALGLAQGAVGQQETASFLDTLGWVELKLGRTEAAITTFERALALSPRASSIRYRLGLALAKKGEQEKALAALREALADGPFAEAEAARQEIARLEQR
jgi:tetratricopeptide (TPR) repeat protein